MHLMTDLAITNITFNTVSSNEKLDKHLLLKNIHIINLESIQIINSGK